MRNLYLLLFFLLLPTISSAQLLDDPYEQELRWQEVMYEEQQRNEEFNQFLKQQDAQRRRAFESLDNWANSVKVPTRTQPAQVQKTQPVQSQQSKAQQQRNQKIASRNAQIAARNAQIEARNAQIEARNAEIEAENRRIAMEKERARIEAEKRRLEQKRKEVTAEAYQRLAAQTHQYQRAASYASGEGAYRLKNQHDVRRYESHIQEGSGNVFGQLNYQPKQNFAFSPNNFVIDPNRVYHLDTWDLSSSEDISYTTSLPPIPSAESIPVFKKFVQEIPNNRLMVYLSIMDFDANKIKSPIETEGAYVFLTNTEDTLYRISKDGNSMFILDLRDPDNWKFKNEVYAKANVGIKHKIGDGKVEYKTNFFSDKPSKAGVKGKVDIDEISVFDQLKWQHVTEEEISKGQSQNDEKTAGQVGAKVGSSLEVSNFSQVNGRYIRFVSDNYALVGDGCIGGGHKPKAKAEIKAELSTSMSKSDVSAGLEVGLDVAEVSLGGGYLKVVENGYYISKVDIKGTAGPSAGVSVGLKRGKVKGFLFGLGWDISKEFVSFPKAN